MIYALIPLRGGSKSIPKKNIQPIAEKPLCAWVIQAALQTRCIDAVVVSTDSEEIANVVRKISSDVVVLDRPPELATDEASTESVMIDVMARVDFETLITIQATSPLLTSADLKSACRSFVSGGYDSMLSAVRTKRFFWSDNARPINYDPMNRPRRQEFLGTLMENGAFYITRRVILEQHKCRLGGRIGIYEMPEASAIEIDEPNDWPIVERLLMARNKYEGE
jgi:CMP-N-acetylneuraminic acid synthetase